MSNKITENTIEEFTIELLERLGYEYIYAPDIAHDGKNPERSSYEEVLLVGRLQNAISRINPKIPIDSQEEALKEIQRINSPELIANNESLHRMLNKTTILDLIRHFVVFEKSKKEVSSLNPSSSAR